MQHQTSEREKSPLGTKLMKLLETEDCCNQENVERQMLWNKVGKMMFHFLNFPAFIWVMIAIPFLKYCCLFFGEVLSSFFGSLLVLTIFSISTGANNIEKRSRSRQTTFSCTDKFLKISLTISLFLGLRNKAQNKTNWIIKTRSLKQQKMCQWILDSLLIKIMSLVR